MAGRAGNHLLTRQKRCTVLKTILIIAVVVIVVMFLMSKFRGARGPRV